jgi:integrase
MLIRSTQPTPVQYLLGHASFIMTLDRYSHWMPSMVSHAADGMAEPLG